MPSGSNTATPDEDLRRHQPAARRSGKARDTAAARRALVLLRDVFASVAPDQSILNQAIDSDIPEFEDAIQLYSALHARADYLLTRNVGDFPAGILPILAPEEFLALLERAADES